MKQQNPDAYDNSEFWESTEELVEVHSDPFWDQLPILQQIRDWSCYHQRNPWGVLMVMIARIGFLISPHVLVDGRLDDDDDPGKLSPLNFYVCGTAASGAGKGVIENSVRAMIPDPEGIRSNDSNAAITSGEGMKSFYGHMQQDRDDGEFHMQMSTIRQWVSIAEISTLTGNAYRSGSIIEGTLNEAWSGSMLCQANADKAKQVIVPRNAYRLCVYVCAQPARAGWITSADGSGLSQRFLWCPITILTPDRMPDIRVPMPKINPKRLPRELSRSTWERAYRDGKAPEPLIIKHPDAYRHAAYQLQNQAAKNPYATRNNSHSVQMQLRIAAVMQLALMMDKASNDSFVISDEAWELAGSVMACSARQLNGFIQAVHDAEAKDQADKLATQKQAQDEADDLYHQRRYEQVSNSIIKYLLKNDVTYSGKLVQRSGKLSLAVDVRCSM